MCECETVLSGLRVGVYACTVLCNFLRLAWLLIYSHRSVNAPPSFNASPPVTDTEDDLESHRSTIVSTSTRADKKQGPSGFELESSQYMGIDAVKKLKTHYTINRVYNTMSELLGEIF